MAKSCRYDIILYLCNVFFIVLDLRLIRLRVRRYSFFLLINHYNYDTYLARWQHEHSFPAATVSAYHPETNTEVTPF